MCLIRNVLTNSQVVFLSSQMLTVGALRLVSLFIVSSYFPTELQINGSSQISSRDRLFKSPDMNADRGKYSEIHFLSVHWLLPKTMLLYIYFGRTG